MNSSKKLSANTKALTESAILIALATILSLIKIYEMPWGGSVTLASMLPIVIIGYSHGIKWGMLSSGVFSLLQMLFGGKTLSAAFLPGEDQMVWYNALIMVFLDYFLAFALVGLSGLFSNKDKPKKSLVLGSLVGTGCRFIAHFLSGWILWGAWADWFFSDFDKTTGTAIGNFFISKFDGQMLSMMYSLFYNAMYMIPEMIITVLLSLVIASIPQISKE